MRAWGLGLFCLFGLSGRLAADLAADLARISVEAAGGRAAHAGLVSFRAIGVTRVGEQEVTFILYAARPRSVRIETIGERGSLVRSFDGIHAPWKKDDPRLPPRRLGQAEERDFMADADFDPTYFDHEARSISLDYAGEVELEGRRYQKLLATVRFTDFRILYLDDETRLLVRRDREKRVIGKNAVVETHYADHRAVAGVLLPHRIRTEVAGRVLHETIIERYDANPALPEDFFAPPVNDWPKL